MKEKFEKWILKMLFKHKLLVFETWKSPIHLEQYTRVIFLGKVISETRWSQLEMFNLSK